jgi:hypothetical protein
MYDEQDRYRRFRYMYITVQLHRLPMLRNFFLLSLTIIVLALMVKLFAAFVREHQRLKMFRTRLIVIW